MKTVHFFRHTQNNILAQTIKRIGLLLWAILTMSFTNPKENNHSMQGSQYVVFFGGVNVNTYHGKIGHLVISDVVYITEKEINPAKKYFNEQVFSDFSAYKNVYSSGYSSYYETFDDKYEALAFRKRLISNTLQVNTYQL